jgi:hypothetical protein
MNITKKYKKYLPKSRLQKLVYGFLVTLPLIAFVFKFSIVYHNGIFRGEDWDYFAQSYDAARLAILHFHQFPWWNPWVNGGQPLFANPQFGLFSIQMPLVLLFGTVAGLHYSIFLYYILGFWGMYLLLFRLGSKSRIISVLLSYIFVFSGFNAWHLAGGQLTFATFLLSPWAFLTILNIHKKRGWLWFGLVASVLILDAMHYLTFETLIICAAIAIFQSVRIIYRKHLNSFKLILPILKPYIWSLIVILVLCGVRIVYTLQFTHEYPRVEPLDPAVSIKMLIAALTFRHAVDPASLTNPGIVNYGWSEFANYFGVITLALFCYLVIKKFEWLKKVTLQDWAIIIATVLAALLTLGAFSSLSPFSLLHHLPIFNQMRVPSRFICWLGLGIIIFLAKLPQKPIIYVLLTISVVDVFAASYSTLNYSQKAYIQTSTPIATFQQYEFFQTNPSLGVRAIINIQNLRLLRSTQLNYGEVYGYEPLLNVAEFYYLPGTDICGINHGCSFVLTHNATVTYWSPNHITLKRTGGGPIRINMNPGKVWQVNNKSPFAKYKLLEQMRPFVINDPSSTINITYHAAL